jgi:hypothetical protein
MAFAALAPILSVAAPVIGAGAGLAGSFLQASGAKEAGAAQAAAALYQAQVAQNNAQIAQQNATYSEEAGLEQSAIAGLKGAAVSGSIKAAQAANNIDVGSQKGGPTSSANLVSASSRLSESLNAQTILSNAELSAYGYRAQAANFAAQAPLDILQAQSARKGADLAAEGDILSGVSGVASKWNQFGSGFSTLTGGGDAFAGSGAGGSSGGSFFDTVPAAYGRYPGPV